MIYNTDLSSLLCIICSVFNCWYPTEVPHKPTQAAASSIETLT